MPILNNDKGVQQAPNFRPTTPRKPLDIGGLISQAAEGAGNVVEAVDFNNQEYIKENIRKAYDVDQKIFGVDAAATLESPVDTSKRTGTDTPEAIKGAVKNLELAREAWQQGKLRESNYHSRLSAVMREMRARFPGYDDQIDQIATRIVGENPDHALRKALMREAADDQHKMDQATRDREHFINANIGHLTALGIDGAAARRMPFEQFRNIVDNAKGLETRMSMRSSQLALEDKEGAYIQNQAKRSLADWGNEVSRLVVTAKMKELGFNTWAEFQKFAVEVTSRPNPPSDKEKDKIIAAFQSMRSAVDLSWQEVTSKRLDPYNEKSKTYLSILDSATLEDIKKKSTVFLDTFEKNFMSGNYGALTGAAARLESEMAGVKYKIFSSDPANKYYSGMVSLMGQEVGGMILKSNPEIIKKLSKVDYDILHRSVTTMGADPKAPSLGEVIKDQHGEQENGVRPTVSLHTARTVVEILKSKDTSPAIRKNLFDSVFGQKNLDFVKYVKDNNLMTNDSVSKLMTELTSESMTNFAFEQGKSNPEIWRTYVDWTTKNLVSRFKRDSDTVKDIQKDPTSNLTVELKEGSFQFAIKPNSQLVGADSGAWGDDPINQAQADTVRRLNEGLRAMSNVYAKQGLDPKLAVQEFAKELKFTNESKEAPWIYGLWNKIKETADEAITKGTNKVKDALPKLPGKRSSYAPDGTEVSPASAAIEQNLASRTPMGYVRELQSSEAGVRTQPISQTLSSVLDHAASTAGVEVDVFSGGQPEIGSGGRRTGSTRHDNGDAADIRLYVRDENGKRRKLDMDRADDRPYFIAFAREAAKAGATGLGAASDYMGPHAMHVGFGEQGTWGSGGSFDTAPKWLREAASEGWSKPLKKKVASK